MNTLILLAILFPAGGAILVGLTKRKLNSLFSVIAVSGMLIMVGAAILKTYPETIRTIVFTLPWFESLAKTGFFGYQLDGLSMLMLTVVAVLGFLVIIYGLGYLSSKNREHASEEGKERHNFWMLMFIASMIGVAISPNLLQLYIFWEMTTLCSYALISHYRNDASLRAGLKALLMTFFGGLFFALGLILIFVNTGSFEFSALGNLNPALRNWVFVFFMIAAWAKSAQIPFFTWLPDAMEAPTTVSMYLHAAAMVKAGVFLIARIGTSALGLSFGSGLLLAIMAIATMLLAVFLFFYQDDLKRLLAYSTIANLAYILFGISLGIMGSRTGAYGGIMHIMNHGIGKALLFLCVGAISYSTGTRSIKQLSGLVKTAPLTSIAFLIGMFAILGIPPFSGFWSKFYLLIGAIEVGGLSGWLLLIPFLAEVIVAFAWFLHVGHKVFFGPVSATAQSAIRIPITISFALLTLMVLTLVVPFIALALVNKIVF